MNNISYCIKDNNINEDIDIDLLISEVNEKHAELEIYDYAVLEIDYSTNYTVKELGLILDYYDICKRKLKKDEIIQIIILFELDEANFDIVNNRKRLWENIKELKENPFFSKYILFELK